MDEPELKLLNQLVREVERANEAIDLLEEISRETGYDRQIPLPTWIRLENFLKIDDSE